MGRPDADSLASLLPRLLEGQGPADLDQAVSVLALLGRGSRPRGGEAGALPVPGAAAASDRAPSHEAHEARIHLAEARYRTLIEQIPAVVFLATVEGGLDDIYVSPQIESLLGFTQREWTGDPVLWYRQLHPEDRGRLSHEFAKTCVTGQPFRHVVRVYSRDGVLVWIHAEARLVRDPSGRPLFLHGVGFDVTEQQRAEETRQKLVLEQEASRLKDEFLATLSHELRTPLHAIVGWAHILKETLGEAPAEVSRAVEIIVRNAEVQSQLVSDLLDVSRIVAGKLVLKLRAVDLVPVIEAALDTVRPAAQAKTIELQTILDPSAGPVSGDPDRLQQVVWNLVSNAIKFSPSRGRVQVRLEAINSHVEIVVEDNGPGIDEETLPHVFESFRQADSSSTRRHTGLGLGLAIVRHLVELHGGTVQAANRRGRPGAVLRVRLPRRSVAEAGPPVFDRHPGAEGGAPGAVKRPLEGVRVLVVDDEEDARNLVAVVLGRCGAQVATVPSAEAAYGKVLAERFDVLIADIEMPGEDGYGLIGRVRALPPERGGSVPAVALTAYATAGDRVRALDAGFQVHLAKPVQPAELTAVVASLARVERWRR